VRFDIDPRRSQVWIEARSSLHPIHSETRGLEGFIDAEVLGGGKLNLTVPPKAHLELPVTELASGNPLLDREMKRRIDARRFPLITGDLQEIRESGRDGRYEVEGDVTFRGVTKRVSDEVSLSVDDDGTLLFEGEHVFDIRDFRMEPPKVLMLKVNPDVTVRVRIVAEGR